MSTVIDHRLGLAIRVLGTDCFLEMDPAYSYHGQQLRTSKQSKHFSECVLNDKEPWTPREERLADMRVMAAIEESDAAGHAVELT